MRSAIQKCFVGRKRLRLFLVLLFAGMVVVLARQPFDQHPQRYREGRMVLGTFVLVDVCHYSDQEPDVLRVYRRLWERMEDLHQTFNAYDDQGVLSRLNRSFPEAVEVTADLAGVLSQAIALSRQTHGAFDPTLKPLIRLWQEAALSGRLPAEQEVALAKSRTGIDKVEVLAGQRIRLASPETQVDLGGIAKGYAVDEAVRILREQGYDNFFIDAGGDIFVSGQRCEGGPWRVGVRDPRRKDQLREVLFVRDAAVTTSGDYEQFFTIGESRFSHIINPLTGYPAAEVVSATVVAPTATVADAWSTALSVLAPGQGIPLLEEQGSGLAAMVITESPEGELIEHVSQGYPKLLKP